MASLMCHAKQCHATQCDAKYLLLALYIVYKLMFGTSTLKYFDFDFEILRILNWNILTLKLWLRFSKSMLHTLKLRLRNTSMPVMQKLTANISKNWQNCTFCNFWLIFRAFLIIILFFTMKLRPAEHFSLECSPRVWDPWLKSTLLLKI